MVVASLSLRAVAKATLVKKEGDAGVTTAVDDDGSATLKPMDVTDEDSKEGKDDVEVRAAEGVEIKIDEE